MSNLLGPTSDNTPTCATGTAPLVNLFWPQHTTMLSLHALRHHLPSGGCRRHTVPMLKPSSLMGAPR
jgi:hypothetical protein